MFIMPKPMFEKFHPNFAIGLLVDPSSAEAINEMRREWNTKFGNLSYLGEEYGSSLPSIQNILS
jgi:hypothetical protein